MPIFKHMKLFLVVTIGGLISFHLSCETSPTSGGGAANAFGYSGSSSSGNTSNNSQSSGSVRR